ncbi:hypothetical protein [Polaromonas sp. A23]|uniref:hypothetical protein n=1 Tax=Polaromonas sp. A23 TaxID=1944133 RepID=UPI0009865C28|nr:hypothetical protein [Polaromonas sp. A23]OOG39838.1 hypothetical protein B0B52_14545 [Polaromonas sp. A23]
MPSLNDEISPQSQPRQLGDDVLQSAEEAVLVNPTSAEAALFQTVSVGGTEAEKGAGGSLSRYQEALCAYVARKPGTSALMAAATGALVAGLLKFALGRRPSDS